MLESETKIFRVFDIFLWRGGRKCGGGQCVKWYNNYCSLLCIFFKQTSKIVHELIGHPVESFTSIFSD